MNQKQVVLPEIASNRDKSSPFVNCITNNYRHLRKWAKRTQTNCFRIYDREINHYPLAIDFYDSRFSVQYFSHSHENDVPPPQLIEETEKVLCSLFGTDPSLIFWRSHVKRKKVQQYEKLNETKEFFTVLEYGIQFKINLSDYLDTGLFLDHRETRKYIASVSSGKTLLNLFAYTCSFSVHAAATGAVFTKSVDMSNTYTEWGKDNFILNSLPLKNNLVVRADCLKFLDEEIFSGKKYDIIIIDPPTISRSKKMDQLFDIQIDYIFLIEKALVLLSKAGFILFSTNSRRFTFDQSQFKSCKIDNVTKKTIPLDFHDPKIHQCWKISRKSI